MKSLFCKGDFRRFHLPPIYPILAGLFLMAVSSAAFAYFGDESQRVQFAFRRRIGDLLLFSVGLCFATAIVLACWVRSIKPLFVPFILVCIYLIREPYLLVKRAAEFEADKPRLEQMIEERMRQQSRGADAD